MGWLKEGPGYTVRDLVYWAGFMVGAMIGFGASTLIADLHPIVRLIGLIGCGVACGFLCETVFGMMSGRPSRGIGRRPPPDDRADP